MKIIISCRHKVIPTLIKSRVILVTHTHTHTHTLWRASNAATAGGGSFWATEVKQSPPRCEVCVLLCKLRATDQAKVIPLLENRQNPSNWQTHTRTRTHLPHTLCHPKLWHPANSKPTKKKKLPIDTLGAELHAERAWGGMLHVFDPIISYLHVYWVLNQSHIRMDP